MVDPFTDAVDVVTRALFYDTSVTQYADRVTGITNEAKKAIEARVSEVIGNCPTALEIYTALDTLRLEGKT